MHESYIIKLGCGVTRHNTHSQAYTFKIFFVELTYFFRVFSEASRKNVVKRSIASPNVQPELQKSVYRELELLTEQKIRAIYSGKKLSGSQILRLFFTIYFVSMF